MEYNVSGLEDVLSGYYVFFIYDCSLNPESNYIFWMIPSDSPGCVINNKKVLETYNLLVAFLGQEDYKYIKNNVVKKIDEAKSNNRVLEHDIEYLDLVNKDLVTFIISTYKPFSEIVYLIYMPKLNGRLYPAYLTFDRELLMYESKFLVPYEKNYYLYETHTSIYSLYS